MRQKMNFGLKTKLLLLSCGSIFALGAWAFYSFSSSLQTQREKVLSEFYSHSTSLSRAIAAQFYERYGDAQAFGLNRVFQTQPFLKTDIATVFDQYVQT